MKLPDPPVAGEPLRASWGAEIIAYLRSLTPRASVDIYPDVSANGTVFNLAKPTAKSKTSFSPRGSETLYAVIALREYDEDGVLVAVGSESSPLASGHSLQATWDWVRAHG